jgi:hypothetical protein
MSKQRHRRRSQGETTPETTPQTASEVAHFSVSEVVQFWMSVDTADAGNEQTLQQTLQIKTAIEAISDLSKITISVLLEVKCMVRIQGSRQPAVNFGSAEPLTTA